MILATCAARMVLGSFSPEEEMRISWCGSTKLTTRSASTESMKYRASMLNSILGDHHEAKWQTLVRSSVSRK